MALLKLLKEGMSPQNPFEVFESGQSKFFRPNHRMTRQRVIKATYGDLVEVLGQPTWGPTLDPHHGAESEREAFEKFTNDKTTCEWNIVWKDDDGLKYFYTVRDHNPKGGVTITDRVTEWIIETADPVHADRLFDYLEDKMHP